MQVPKEKRTARHMVITAALIAAGVLLPLAFHALGGGKVFLPMQIPIFIAAFLLPARWAAGTAAATPVLSALLTGMPPFWPVLPLMVCELLGYALFTNLFARKLRLPTYIALVLGMLAGRGVLLLAALVMQAAAGAFDGLAYVAEALAAGIPGMVLQIAAVPPIVFAAKKAMGYTPSKPKGEAQNDE